MELRAGSSPSRPHSPLEPPEGMKHTPEIPIASSCSATPPSFLPPLPLPHTHTLTAGSSPGFKDEHHVGPSLFVTQLGSQLSIFGVQKNTLLSSSRGKLRSEKGNRNRAHMENLNPSRSFRIFLETMQGGRKSVNPDRLGFNVEFYHRRLCDLSKSLNLRLTDPSA